MSEPYVWLEFRKLCCCCLKKPQKQDVYAEESLDSFIKSACNSEYASFSLAGVMASIRNGNQTFFALESYFVENKESYNVTSKATMGKSEVLDLNNSIKEIDVETSSRLSETSLEKPVGK